MALSPWPSTPMAVVAATETLRSAISGADAASFPDARVQAIGAAASALVEDYAPDAPQAVRDEALIRCAGYLAGSDFGGIASESIGPQSYTWTVNHADMFRRSGAAALLSSWRVRRAGLIG